MRQYLKPKLTLAAVVALGLGLQGCDDPSEVEAEQTGYRGTGMAQIVDTEEQAALRAANQVPEPLPPAPDAGPRAGDVYQNVQVLGDLSTAQFLRVMRAMTEWVSPEQGCNYCHVEGNMASDDIYTKVVSRRMIQMTQNINTQWVDHVAETGVTCYTCHRGQNVPEHIWFENPGPKQAQGMAGYRGGQNSGEEMVGMTSLPYDPYTPLISGDGDESIRVSPTSVFPGESRPDTSIQDAERTYSLMIHFSNALGVNCGYCHNSRAFDSWPESTPQRMTAWHGIQMVRDLNKTYLQSLQSEFPAKRLGPLGDVPKLNCTTCHQGVNKPLYGESMIGDYPSLAPDPDQAASAADME